LVKLFKQVNAKQPTHIKILSNKEKFSTGLVEWLNESDCIEALILANNFEIKHSSK
jgi:hypothetical protein